MLIGIVAVVLTISPAFPAGAAHPVSGCGQLLEYSAAPGADPTSGLGRMRLATLAGELSFLFHHYSASNAAFTLQPGATTVGAFVCVSGTHVESASPVRSDYVALHRLVLAVPTSLPSTSTAAGTTP